MFKPLRMKHVQIHLLTEDLPLAALMLAELQLFSPDYRPSYVEHFTKIPGRRFRELYHQAASRLEKIKKHVALTSPAEAPVDLLPSLELLKETNVWLGQMWERCSSYEEAFHHIDEEERLLDQLDEALNNFSALNFDLGLLQGEKSFLDIHIGNIPKQNAPQLRDALSLADYIMYEYLGDEQSIHVVVLGLKGRREKEVASVLDTAGFHPLPIPAELHDEPSKVREELQSKRQQLKLQREQENGTMVKCANDIRSRLERSEQILMICAPYVEIDTAARSSGHLSIISGWLPSKDIKRVCGLLDAKMHNPIQIETRDPFPSERGLVPSYMPKNRLMTPFATLVKQYGIPRYGEIDPTSLFALTFIAMFGMMFGDIGHGLMIILIAWLLRHKLKSFTVFAMATGFSATLFGALYGSVFGYEEISHALWIPPLTNPIYMLKVALFWGIGFLLIISLISIYNRLIEAEYTAALFENNGIISLLLYISVLYGIFRFYTQGHFGVATAIVSIITLLSLLGYKLIETQASPGERMLVATIETFETLTGYISNTLSFLRVAAFSLNHAALAIAVFTLAEMMDSTGHWIAVILGNIFILVVEGAIVTIQALRLEYYEGFSRFFSGDGREFTPLQLHLAEHQ